MFQLGNHKLLRMKKRRKLVNLIHFTVSLNQKWSVEVSVKFLSVVMGKEAYFDLRLTTITRWTICNRTLWHWTWTPCPFQSHKRKQSRNKEFNCIVNSINLSFIMLLNFSNKIRNEVKMLWNKDFTTYFHRKEMSLRVSFNYQVKSNSFFLLPTLNYIRNDGPGINHGQC